jgi:hypothetical protein
MLKKKKIEASPSHLIELSNTFESLDLVAENMTDLIGSLSGGIQFKILKATILNSKTAEYMSTYSL